MLLAALCSFAWVGFAWVSLAWVGFAWVGFAWVSFAWIATGVVHVIATRLSCWGGVTFVGGTATSDKTHHSNCKNCCT
jgi:hypothetical protein